MRVQPAGMSLVVALVWTAGLGMYVAAGRQPHVGMLVNPDVSATHIVFSYANDLWVVPRDGGVAIRYQSNGVESFPLQQRRADNRVHG